MGRDRLREAYADLVEEGAAEFFLDDGGNVAAVLLTHVDQHKLADVERAYGEEFDRRLAIREVREREAAKRLEDFILD